jgi:hypothetical protein
VIGKWQADPVSPEWGPISLFCRCNIQGPACRVHRNGVCSSLPTWIQEFNNIRLDKKSGTILLLRYRHYLDTFQENLRCCMGTYSSRQTDSWMKILKSANVSLFISHVNSIWSHKEFVVVFVYCGSASASPHYFGIRGYLWTISVDMCKHRL